MTITRVTDDPGITSTHASQWKEALLVGAPLVGSTPDVHRWLVWALLVEIPLDTQGKTRHHGHLMGS